MSRSEPLTLSLHRRQTPARGLAALTIVMVLFLIMAMVAAYTNRNLVFEQRTSANSYRAERALAAADAGIDWALSMLNSGRIDTRCSLDADGGSSYRARYLTTDTEGRISVATGTGGVTLYSGCTNVDGALSCGCPTADSPTVSVSNSADPPGNAFRVSYFVPGGAARAGAIALNVQGCGTPGVSDANCVSASTDPQVDGRARVVVTLGMVRALPTPPVAALTAANMISAAGVELQIGNQDNLTGATVHTGAAGPTDAASTSRYVVPAGGGGNGWLVNDGALFQKRLQNLADGATASDGMFTATFGMDGPNYRRQQGVVRKTCTAACGIGDLDYMLKLFPGRTLWFDGDLSIDGSTTAAAGSIGTVAQPALVIVTGTLGVQRDNPMVGLFYASAVNWSAAGASLRGALISASDFTATSRATISYDADVINAIVTSYGTFVRAPGSWNRTTF
ncbi:PilX N-terminal domain-containing pilus assembly protein [Ideonella sp. DXS22W]|uniref:PilX N-terminal domain-containing pilus assembly protein n=1 Tax=Pseudaquabacterium inlustre TaxID=2984192 RepID=A0ABU9CC71_9BURK